MRNKMLFGMLMMTLASEGVEGAGVISATDAVTLPDTTEGNRGPSSTARSGNVGDPTLEIHGDAGEVVADPAEEPVIANSTNAYTDMAHARLSPMQEVTVKLDREIKSTYDIMPAFSELLGTTNIKPGPFNSAFRSIKFKYPEAHGQRGCIVYKDGNVKLLASGTTYADWYGMSRADDVACAAIVYFNQSVASDNPFVSVRWYKKAELPETQLVDDEL